MYLQIGQTLPSGIPMWNPERAGVCLNMKNAGIRLVEPEIPDYVRHDSISHKNYQKLKVVLNPFLPVFLSIPSLDLSYPARPRVMQFVNNMAAVKMP
jgi:hypothetical protein